MHCELARNALFTPERDESISWFVRLFFKHDQGVGVGPSPAGHLAK